MQSVELHTHNSGNNIDLVIGPQKFIVKLRNFKNGNLVYFNEVWFYHLWSVVRSPLVDSFLETFQTKSDHDASVIEKGISQHDCPFYDFELTV